MAHSTKWVRPDSSSPDFHKDLSRGKTGEAALLGKFPNLLVSLQGTGPDFRLLGSQTYLELKTDYYDMSKTPFFFMEAQSRPGHKGGPWQALEKGSKYFIYYFIKNDSWHIFETEVLVSLLNLYRHHYAEAIVKNKNYETLGIKVPRSDLKAIELTFKDIGL